MFSTKFSLEKQLTILLALNCTADLVAMVVFFAALLENQWFVAVQAGWLMVVFQFRLGSGSWLRHYR